MPIQIKILILHTLVPESRLSKQTRMGRRMILYSRLYIIKCFVPEVGVEENVGISNARAPMIITRVQTIHPNHSGTTKVINSARLINFNFHNQFFLFNLDDGVVVALLLLLLLLLLMMMLLYRVVVVQVHAITPTRGGGVGRRRTTKIR